MFRPRTSEKCFFQNLPNLFLCFIMENIFQDETKIKFYAQVQKNLCLLEPDATDEKINEIISQIPQEYLTEKENLKIICQLFAIYARNKYKSKKSNAIRLFEQIMNYLKSYLQGESSFFWNILGGLFNFKLWMYRENLISIDHINLVIKRNNSPLTAEYFLPEIIEEEPEIFDKEIKHAISIPYSNESIEKFKQIREKHFKWIRYHHGDYNDPLYKEIETNQLRLSIKLDDVETFQRILSNTNLSLNSKIQENIHDNFLCNPYEMPLIVYIFAYNPINIIKFLIMKDIKIPVDAVYHSISNNSLEIIHLLESKIGSEYESDSLRSSVVSWNYEMTEYVLNNHETYEFLQKDEMSDEEIKTFMLIINETFCYSNFIFFDSVLLPILRNKKKFVNENIYKIINYTFCDMCCFFTKEFFKYPNLDVNYVNKDFDRSILGQAIHLDNFNAVEFLLSMPKININGPCFGSYPASLVVCSIFSDLKILKLLISCKEFEAFYESEVSVFLIAGTRGNFYAIDFIVNEIQDFHPDKFDFHHTFYKSLDKKNLFTLKVLLKHYLQKFDNKSCDSIILEIKNEFSGHITFKKDFFDDFKQIYDEVVSSL